MEKVFILIIAIAALIMIMAALGMPLSAIVRASKLPAWAKFNPNNSWGVAWLDKSRWLKVILIKLGQAVIFCFLFFINFIIAAIKAAINAFVKALEGTAKKVVKK
ncbi:MAG: hypothetical protein WCK59_02240 [Candidatus Falkowbacteria bacterium]